MVELTPNLDPNAGNNLLFLIHGLHNETELIHAWPNKNNTHVLGGGHSQLEWRQVYTDKCIELGDGRERRRGVAGAREGIYIPDFAFPQSACFQSSATPSCLARCLKKTQDYAISKDWLHSNCYIYPEFVSLFPWPEM